MAVLVKNKVIKDIGINPETVLDTDASTRSTIIGLSLTNLTNLFVYVSLMIDDDTSVTGYYLKDTILPAGSSLRAVSTGEKLVLGPNNRLSAKSSADDSIDIIVSYVETA